MQKLQKGFYLTLGIALIIWSFYIFLNRSALTHYQEYQGRTLIQIGERTIQVEIADTDTKRNQGLSGRIALASREGLLFVFDTPGNYGFWMKDMHFPIDIVWIDENWRVVNVERGVLPETFPQTFYPIAPVKYVLEINSGDASRLGIDTTSKLYLDRKN